MTGWLHVKRGPIPLGDVLRPVPIVGWLGDADSLNVNITHQKNIISLIYVKYSTTLT